MQPNNNFGYINEPNPQIRMSSRHTPTFETEYPSQENQTRSAFNQDNYHYFQQERSLRSHNPMNTRHQMAQNVQNSRIDMGYVENMRNYDDQQFTRNERPRRQTNRMARPHMDRRDQFLDNPYENSLSDDDRAERSRNSPPYNNIQMNHQANEPLNQNLKNLEDKFTRILGDQVIIQFDGSAWMAKFQGRLFSVGQMEQMCQREYESNREREAYREREDPYLSYGSMPQYQEQHVHRQTPKYPQEQSSLNYPYAPMNYQAPSPYERMPYSRRKCKALSL